MERAITRVYSDAKERVVVRIAWVLTLTMDVGVSGCVSGSSCACGGQKRGLGARKYCMEETGCNRSLKGMCQDGYITRDHK